FGDHIMYISSHFVVTSLDSEDLLGTIKTSPFAVNKAAWENRLNGQEYHALGRNCQDWVIQLLNDIDPSGKLRLSLEEKDIQTIKETSVKYLRDALILASVSLAVQQK
uniref:Uncharacterized protein n=1 Tax=Clytia hemisphaerica TaxID=252671 RepID=A0A7M5XAS6_9CNID